MNARSETPSRSCPRRTDVHRGCASAAARRRPAAPARPPGPTRTKAHASLWLHQREQALDEEHGFSQDFYHQLADTMIEVPAAVDPTACRPAEAPDGYRYWPEVFHDEAGGVL
ncbi:SUKH-4 family immunity protein [Streptomyces cyanogenus]|uniref:Uncharacterized protein n=1 Tax=Streptomyces cyanogenus TaxID=80860 RepID=A0ABX7U424_STRCY|nr:SUKH-4 family immunity protein [Streptomyces cyanogenus]QTE02839.1 hypothetical protein S1361_36235 [Streptomyces cyanogenus]